VTPTDAAIKNALALRAAGRLDEAIDALRKVVLRDPRHANSHYALAGALFEGNRLDQAAYHAEKAAELVRGTPTAPLALNMLGSIRHAAGDLEKSLAAYEAALALSPDRPEVLRNFARLLGEIGRPEDACASLRRARDLAPPGQTRLVFQQELAQALNYMPGVSPVEVFQEHQHLGAMFGAPPAPPAGATRAGPIRIGYLSGDFRTHSVAFFFEPLLAAHDPARVHVTCYATTNEEDATTGRLRSKAGAWRNITRMNDADACAAIRADGIDVLVDLAGLTVGHRLGVLARGPAPVLCSFLGYPNTTGVPRVNYRIVDALTDPTELDATAPICEQRWRLSRPIWSWRPPTLPEGFRAGVPRPPGPVTFGSFNTITKVNLPLLDLWARILAATPGSRLLLKGKGFTSGPARRHILARLGAGGVEPDRVELIERTASLAEHLAIYSRMDIALDTIPYHGTTTTCEALWMGVPVVTQVGASHVSRVGLSLLHAVAPGVDGGVEDLIASGPDEYVAKATALARDESRRAALRATLGPALLASPLCDAAGLARALEDAYGSMLAARGVAS
jgi:predicted O-linked N-acetylglucosamine transferase (SPINDLY family)